MRQPAREVGTPHPASGDRGPGHQLPGTSPSCPFVPGLGMCPRSCGLWGGRAQGTCGQEEGTFGGTCQEWHVGDRDICECIQHVGNTVPFGLRLWDFINDLTSLPNYLLATISVHAPWC